MRTKIIFPYFLAVLLLGVGGYWYINHALNAKAEQRTIQKLQTMASLFQRSEALSGYENLAELRKFSMSRHVTAAFRPVELEMDEGESQEAFDNRVRDEWFRKVVTAIEETASLFEKAGKKPALLFVTDRNGVAIARNTTPNACPAGRRVAEAIPVVQRALDGEASYEMWSIEGSRFDKRSEKERICSIMNVGVVEMLAAPIWGQDDQVAGSIAVGFEVSSGAASRKAKALGMELAVLNNGEVYSSSFSSDTAREDLNSDIQQEKLGVSLKEALVSGKSTGVLTNEIEGEIYHTLAVPVANAAEGSKIGYLFMASVTQSQEHRGAMMVFVGFVVFVLIGVFVIGLVLANHFMRPIFQIEEGLLKLINGEFDYRFDIKSSEMGGLGYRINQLVNVFTDQDESSDDDESK